MHKDHRFKELESLQDLHPLFHVLRELKRFEFFFDFRNCDYIAKKKMQMQDIIGGVFSRVVVDISHQFSDDEHLGQLGDSDFLAIVLVDDLVNQL